MPPFVAIEIPSPCRHEPQEESPVALRGRRNIRTGMIGATGQIVEAGPHLQLDSMPVDERKVDGHAAGMRGVTVSNTPGVNAFAVAEHALALMLAVGRKIPAIDREMRGGYHWIFTAEE